MLRIFLVVATGLFSLPGLALDLVRYPTLLTNNAGIKAQVLPTTDGQQALLQVKGVNHAVDGVVFLAEAQDRGQGGVAYRIHYDGEPRGLLMKTQNWRGEGWRLYLPRGAGEFDLAIDNDKDVVDAFDLEDMQTQYQTQLDEGVQETLASFDRPRRQQEHTNTLSRKDTEAGEQCGRSLETVVDWKSINDEQLMQLSVSSFCGVVVDEMATLCRNDDSFKPVLKDIGKVECRFGERLNLSRKGNALQLTTERDAPNQGEFVKGFLRNL